MPLTTTQKTELQALRAENRTLRAENKSKDDQIAALEKVEAAYAKAQARFEEYKKLVKAEIDELERIVEEGKE